MGFSASEKWKGSLPDPFMPAPLKGQFTKREAEKKFTCLIQVITIYFSKHNTFPFILQGE